MNRARADALLLLVALLWGTTFVAQKLGGTTVGPLAFVAVRFLTASVFLLPIAIWEARRATVALRPADLAGGLLIGACLCAGCLLQQTALASTTATNAGFLTAVYMVLVPFVAWIVLRRPPRALVLVACAVALLGAWLLAGPGGKAAAAAGGWSQGDILILGSDLIWALHITLIAQLRGIASRPILLSLMQCAVTGIVSLPAALVWQPVSGAALMGALPSILYAGIVSSGIAFTLQIVAQRHTPPAEAALIMSLESVFSALAGAVVLGEMLSLRAAVGAALIMLGVVLVETSSALLTAAGALRGRKRSSAQAPLQDG
jgi:drug/metabolite transporter (DMT)-like permease